MPISNHSDVTNIDHIIKNQIKNQIKNLAPFSNLHPPFKNHRQTDFSKLVSSLRGFSVHDQT